MMQTQEKSDSRTSTINWRSRKLFYIGIVLSLLVAALLTGDFNSSNSKIGGIIAGLGIVTLMIAYKPASLRIRQSYLFLAVFAYSLWLVLSIFYAEWTLEASIEIAAFLPALFLYLFLFRFSKDNEVDFKKIICILAVLTGVIGLLSIEFATSNVIWPFLRKFIGSVIEVSGNTKGFEPGTRILGIFNESNNLAGVMAIGTLFSLFLVQSSKSKKERLLSASLFMTNAIAFFLLFSIGCMLSFLAGIIVWLIALGKGKRMGALVILLETLLLTVAASLFCFKGFGQTGILGWLPLLFVLAAGPIFFVADLWLRSNNRVSKSHKGKVLPIVLACIVLLALVVSLIRGPISLSTGESVRRVAYLDTGTYTFTIHSSAPVTVQVTSQNDADLMKHTAIVLYSGNEKTYKITVPKGSQIVKTVISGTTGKTTISAIEYTGTENGHLTTSYKFLPGFIVNRFQDLWANENVIQRMVFFTDGLKLFAQSPIIGHGIGSFQNGQYSVQSFDYFTRYVHNHYIQMLCDLGIIGFLLFVALLILAFVSLFQAQKAKKALFAVPVLFAVLTQISVSGLSETVWSSGLFEALAFMILALITVFCSKPLPQLKIAICYVEKIAAIVLSVMMVVILSINIYSGNIVSKHLTLPNLKTFSTLDWAEGDMYRMCYVINSGQATNPAVVALANQYSDHLLHQNNYMYLENITPYLFASGQYDMAFESIKRTCQLSRSKKATWDNAFTVIRGNLDTTRLFFSGLQPQQIKNYLKNAIDVYEQLRQRNSECLDSIPLQPKTITFLNRVQSALGQNGDINSVQQVFFTTLFDSRYKVDADGDNCPDNVQVTGQAVWNTDGSIRIQKGTTLKLSVFSNSAQKSELQFNSFAQPEMTLHLNGAPVQPGQLTDLPANAVSTYEITFVQDTVLNGIKVSAAG